MPFTEKLPEWFAAGTEPTTTQKTTGYTPGLKPPAQWFNWHLNTAYLAMLELQQNAVHKEEIESRFNIINTKKVTLNAGVQIITAVKSALFSLDGVTGRMLVNLLGRMGNCESVGLWSSNTTIATDTANKTSGISSFKLTLGSVPATASASFLTTPGKKYIAVADVKNGNTSKIAISINGIAGATGNDVAVASAFAPSVVRFAATDFFHILTITGTGSSGNTFNMDSVRVYEVADADYAAAASLTPAQAATKYPYVDSVMPVRNPYAIRYGENLFPSFFEHTVSQFSTSKLEVKNPYEAVFTATQAGHPWNAVIPVKGGATYTLSYTSSDASTAYINLQWFDAQGNALGYTDQNQNGQTVQAPINAVQAKTIVTSIAAGMFTFTNPMLNIGSTAKLFKPREDFMLALQTDLYADPVTGANADTVFERDGQYFKAKKWYGGILDGNMSWLLSSGFTGYKEVRVPITPEATENAYMYKFDGKILVNRKATAVSGGDQFSLNANGYMYLSISNADSGWGDSYTPTPDEIKAYFMGWTMFNGETGGTTPDNPSGNVYNGVGRKYWARRSDGVSRNSWLDGTDTLPTTQAPNWTPYQLVYQLATSTVEPIVSEGQLSFVEGDNQVEVGTGIVLRERNETYQQPVEKLWNINNANYTTTAWLKQKASDILAIYKNGKRDHRWMITNKMVTSAGALAQQHDAYHDTGASYSVTYLTLDKSPVASFVGSYAANEKTLLADLVDSIQQNTARVSVLEDKKTDRDSTPVRFYPTLINGWEKYFDYSPSFYKDSSGLVHLEGIVKNGIMDKAIFVLPKGFRPKNSPLLIGVASHNQTSSSRIEVGADGQVIVYNASAVWTNLSDVSFLAEQ